MTPTFIHEVNNMKLFFLLHIYVVKNQTHFDFYYVALVAKVSVRHRSWLDDKSNICVIYIRKSWATFYRIIFTDFV